MTAVLTPLLAVAMLCLASAPPAGAGAATPGAGSGTLDPADPYFPQLGNSGYDVEHYDLGITFLPPSRVLHGDTRIQATATAQLRSFHLDLTGLAVQRVDVDGKRARFTRNGGELVIRPRVALAKGARFRVRVRYSGTPEPGTIPGSGGARWMDCDERRRDHAQRARRREPMVPIERSPVRQGIVHVPHHHV